MDSSSSATVSVSFCILHCSERRTSIFTHPSASVCTDGLGSPNGTKSGREGKERCCSPAKVVVRQVKGIGLPNVSVSRCSFSKSFGRSNPPVASSPIRPHPLVDCLVFPAIRHSRRVGTRASSFLVPPGVSDHETLHGTRPWCPPQGVKVGWVAWSHDTRPDSQPGPQPTRLPRHPLASWSSGRLFSSLRRTDPHRADDHHQEDSFVDFCPRKTPRRSTRDE